MSSKNDRNAALKAIIGGQAASAAASVELTAPAPEPMPAIVAERPAVAAPSPRAKAKPAVAKVMLYLPPKVAKKFKEMAFHEECKAHDLYVAALDDYLRRKGHSSAAELLSKAKAH